MGYCMDIRDHHFKIPAHNVAAAHQAILDIPEGHPYTGNGGGYAWVRNFRNTTSLEEAMLAWRWEGEIDEAGDFVMLWFGGEKYGDEDVLFEAIAPFVEEGSFLEMQGEDGSIWRWRFHHGRVEEVHALLVWPEVPDV